MSVVARLTAAAAALLAPGKPDKGRSGKWPAVRKAHLRAHPACVACGRTGGNDVHHVKPFHLWPELETDPTNCATFCPPCHHVIAHAGNYALYVATALEDAARHRESVRAALAWRPSDPASLPPTPPAGDPPWPPS